MTTRVNGTLDKLGATRCSALLLALIAAAASTFLVAVARSDRGDDSPVRPSIVLEHVDHWPEPFSPAITNVTLCAECKLLPTDAIHELVYWSVDIAGNMEAQKSAVVRIDKTNPGILVASRTPPANEHALESLFPKRAVAPISAIVPLQKTLLECL